MNKFSKKGMRKVIDDMITERDNLVKAGAKKDLQFRELRQELGGLSLDIETKNRSIKDLEIKFGFKTEKDFLPEKPKE